MTMTCMLYKYILRKKQIYIYIYLNMVILFKTAPLMWDIDCCDFNYWQEL